MFGSRVEKHAHRHSHTQHARANSQTFPSIFPSRNQLGDAGARVVIEGEDLSMKVSIFGTAPGDARYEKDGFESNSRLIIDGLETLGKCFAWYTRKVHGGKSDNWRFRPAKLQRANRDSEFCFFKLA